MNNMKVIRDEYGAEFVEEITRSFVKGSSSALFTEEELLEEVSFIRSQDYDPIFMELSLALWQLLGTKCMIELRKHSEARSLGEAQIELHKAEGIIQEKMITFLKGRQSELGRRAALERHRKDPKQRDKQFVRDYWDRWQREPNLYRSQEEFARDMLEKFGEEAGGSLTSSETIKKKWIPEWRRTKG